MLFQLPDQEEIICVPIPELIWRWPWPDDPEHSWIHWGDEAVNPADLTIVATMRELVSKVSDADVQGTLQAAVQDAVKIAESKLPRGAELHGAER